MSIAVCLRCGGSGSVIDRAAGTWDVCACPAGAELTATIRRGQADIKAGRLHRWNDVRRRIFGEDS